ncbi:MAG: type 4a pilus biogenesis protein PilO [bacterium]
MKKIIAFNIAIWALLIGISWQLFSPYLSKTWAVKQKIRENQGELEKLHQQSNRSTAWDEQYTYFQNGIQYLTDYLPRQGELEHVSQKLRQKAKDFGVDDVEVSFDHSFLLRGMDSHDPALYLKVIPFRIHVEGDFFHVYRFLEWIEEMPSFLGIDTMEILSKSQKSSSPVLEANLSVHMATLSHERIDFLNPFPENKSFHLPGQPSPDLITAQKNLRIRSLGRNLFVSGKSMHTDEQAMSGRPLPRDTGATPYTRFTLNGIVSFPEGYMALINNQRVKKGDVVEGREVVWITKNSVCLARGSEKTILNLK